MNYLVIPDGIRADSNSEPISEPSFVFKQVLDYLVKVANSKDTIFIAPANNFGGNEYEHELAYRYLIENISTEPPNIQYPVMTLVTICDSVLANTLTLQAMPYF